MGTFAIGDAIAQIIFALVIILLIIMITRFINGGKRRKNEQLAALEERVDRLEKQGDKK